MLPSALRSGWEFICSGGTRGANEANADATAMWIARHLDTINPVAREDLDAALERDAEKEAEEKRARAAEEERVRAAAEAERARAEEEKARAAAEAEKARLAEQEAAAAKERRKLREEKASNPPDPKGGGRGKDKP